MWDWQLVLTGTITLDHQLAGDVSLDMAMSPEISLFHLLAGPCTLNAV
jgi:hypothetical protein